VNNRQLEKLGVPPDCLNVALQAVQAFVKSGLRAKDIKQEIPKVLADPQAFLQDQCFGELARAVIEDRSFTPMEPVSYSVWGNEFIDEGSHSQMRQACSVPVARAAALMPDAHIGYGLPIGGVLACENAVIPYAVGVDIACRMKLSVLDLPAEHLDSKFNLFKESLENGTRFGVGKQYDRPHEHPVMDQDWTVTRITREKKATAWKQLGTSGSGNHFVEFGVVKLTEADTGLGLQPGEYVGLLSHSGSRGAGSAVCSTYSAIAESKLPRKYQSLGRLAWLDLDTDAGQEYWLAMNLMGDYAAANHDVIHRQVSKLLGASIISGVENHHNFAWKEVHGGRELIVHRKGATPAGRGVLGVIPGSMATPAYVVRGLGNESSLHSASHGAGRLMSRKAAMDKFRWNTVRVDLERKGVRVLSAGADEVPGAYKDIREVIAAQSDLVEIVAQFHPRIVKMCDDGSRAED
jgi:tRNA-splicing ligase RtcB